MKSLDLNDKNTDFDDDDSGISKSIFTIILLMVLEISFLIKGYRNCSPIIDSNSVFFPFIKSYHQNIAEINLTIENLTERNRFLQIDLAFYRYLTGNNLLMDGEYNYSVEFFLNNQSVAYKSNQHGSFNYIAYNTYFNFIPQTIFYETISSFDKISSNLTIYTNLTLLKGMSLDYFYVNSNFVQLYRNISAIFTSFSIFTFIRFLIFCFSKQNTVLSTNDKFLLVLSILTILSSIDYQYFFDGVKFFKLNILTMDMLIILFRMYTIYLLDSIINRSNSISEAVYTEMIRYFFFFFAMLYHDNVQFNSKIFARLAERPGSSIPMIKLFILFFHIWYIGLTIYYLFRAYTDPNKNTRNKAKFYGRYIIFVLINTFVVRIVLMIHFFHDNSALNFFIYRFSYIISSIIIINIRTESKHSIDEYQIVDENNNTNDDNTLFPNDLLGDDAGIELDEKDNADIEN